VEQNITHVGLDVHKDTILVALAESGRRGLRPLQLPTASVEGGDWLFSPASADYDLPLLSQAGEN
jgi:hypothetical protein